LREFVAFIRNPEDDHCRPHCGHVNQLVRGGGDGDRWRLSYVTRRADRPSLLSTDQSAASPASPASPDCSHTTPKTLARRQIKLSSFSAAIAVPSGSHDVSLTKRKFNTQKTSQICSVKIATNLAVMSIVLAVWQGIKYCAVTNITYFMPCRVVADFTSDLSN